MNNIAVKEVYRQRVKDAMVTDVVAVSPTDTLNEALTLMVENRVSAVPVTDGRERCLGMISATDLLGLAKDLGDELNSLSHIGGLARDLLVEKLSESDLLTQPVQDLMTEQVVNIGPDDTLAKAASLLVRNHIHRLAVVDRGNHVLGVLSTMDILRAFAEGAPEGEG